MQVQVTIQDAYDEACRALGEEVVQHRIMARQATTEMQRLQAEIERLEQARA